MNIFGIITTLLNLLNEMSPYILLGFLFCGILHAFVTPRLLTRHLSGNGFKEAMKAALIGVPLPLCSCGVLPTAISLRRSGASTAATTSFLISTPQTGVDSIAATYSLLGPAFAIARPIAAFVTAVLGGSIIGKITKNDTTPTQEGEHDCHDDDCHGAEDSCCAIKIDAPTPHKSVGAKVMDMLHYGFIEMVESVGGWLVAGLVVAALITVLVPDDIFVGLAEYPLPAMIAVVIIAIPMYVCATGSIPIALSLMLKGLTPGVAFVFLMAGPAANFASYTLLSRTLGKRSTLTYIATIAISAIIIGLIIDYLLPSGWFMPHISHAAACCEESASWFSTLCSILLACLLIYTLLMKKGIERINRINRTETKTETTHIDTAIMKEYKINGVACSHCKGRVEKGISSLPGVKSVNVDLKRGTTLVEGDCDAESIKQVVESLGYEYAGEVNGK